MDTDNQIYRNLQKHLDNTPVGFPEAKSGRDLRFLKHFFTPEEAEIAVQLSRMKLEPIIRIPPIPGLQPIRDLAVMDQGSDEARFLKTGLVRQRNSVSHALSQAIKLMDAIEKG